MMMCHFLTMEDLLLFPLAGLNILLVMMALKMTLFLPLFSPLFHLHLRFNMEASGLQ
jgi:hypothetical protein